MDSVKTHFPPKLQQIPLPATDLGRSPTQRNVKPRLVRVLWHVAGLALLLLVVNSTVRREGRHTLHLSYPKHRYLHSKEREHLFLSIPSPESALAASRAYATHPHLAGSSEDLSDAKVMLELFQTEFGISPPPEAPIFPAGSPESRAATLHLTTRKSNQPSAWIDTYYPVLNTPIDHSLEILNEKGDAVWTAELEEDGDPLDEDAHKYKDSVSAWHGLSKDGTAEGKLIYANYGTKEDYDNLVSAGANLTGKIVVTRYGAVFRGLKIKGAQELGASGVLIYSDPRDDGFVTVENGYAPYPAGPARNPTSVQRGSVQFLSIYPGDPTTPGLPAYENADRKEATNIPGIPSLPISWKNAERLLEEIGEIYSVGKDGKTMLSGKISESTVKLVNHVNTKVTPIWNTMASIPGHIRDEIVVVGCHRDAWVLGAADPTSGTVSLHEIIRGFGALHRKGWKPLRTIVFASWDAEEYGLVGSTEWGEDFATWISDHVVAYLNVDVSVSGSRWSAGGSPSLAHLIKRAALEISHPTIKGKTLWDARTDEGPFSGTKSSNISVDVQFMEAYGTLRHEIRSSETGIYPLGSGSDYTVFLQRLGVASLDQGFGLTPTDAVYHYHSIYDSERFQELYADPGFHRHVAVAKHLGLLALRIVDSIIIPLNTTQYALELDDYLKRVENLVPDLPASSEIPDFTKLRKAIGNVQSASMALDKERAEAEKEFKDILRKLPWHGKCQGPSRFMRHVRDWIKGAFGVPPHQYLPIHGLAGEHPDSWKRLLDLNELLLSEAEGYPRHIPIRKLINAAKRIYRTNKKIMAFERGFISQDGIKDREWYKHLGVAPGKWLGYGATTFPALTEALTIERNTTLADHEASRLTELLDKLTAHLRR
ncbi:Zn-dependent exopeptidase [Collybia nuda]|uniref:Zn-dependent exopeptidase n=1 Tax=Collybia nuda TaxID=64659 RepID=A0A9P5Y8Z6_9AGAR|nr:Zn-dependent exopeptidase [Collybia nuda]